jgi:hypothetical protein
MWGHVFSRERLQIWTIGLNLKLDDFKKESSEKGLRSIYKAAKYHCDGI